MEIYYLALVENFIFLKIILYSKSDFNMCRHILLFSVHTGVYEYGTFSGQMSLITYFSHFQILI